MIRPFVTDAYALEDADPEFLYDLTLFAKGLLLQLDTGSAPEGSPSARQLKSLSYTWRDIRSKLRKGEAAVEFVQYMPFRGLPRMGAIVLRHGDRPRWVFQPAPGRIDGLFGSDIDDGERWNKDRVYRGDRLAGLVWTPELRKALGDAKTVFFAPDGCYHNIAIEYVLPDSTVEARRLTSTRRLMERGSESRSFSATDPMLLFGDMPHRIRDLALAGQLHLCCHEKDLHFLNAKQKRQTVVLRLTSNACHFPTQVLSQQVQRVGYFLSAYAPLVNGVLSSLFAFIILCYVGYCKKNFQKNNPTPKNGIVSMVCFSITEYCRNRIRP